MRQNIFGDIKSHRISVMKPDMGLVMLYQSLTGESADVKLRESKDERERLKDKRVERHVVR